MRQRVIIFCILAAVATAACGKLRVPDAVDTAPAEDALRAKLQSRSRPAFVTKDEEGSRLWKLTLAFYDRRGDKLAWIDEKHPTAQMDGLIRALEAADREGLDPEMYSLAALRMRREEAASGFVLKRGFQPEQAAGIDIFLTYLYMKYASDLADGISDLARADAAWRIEAEQFDPLEHLERALATNRVADSLLDLTPASVHYTRLREALAVHRQLAADGGWPLLPETLRLRPGDESDDVRLLARRLAASGDFRGPVPDAGAMAYDDVVVQAVKRFQRRHGLEEDGRIGQATIAEMNVSIDRRIDQIRLNMERWRWLPRDLGERHILVNIPAFWLEVWDRGDVPLEMRVVVGKKDTPTPIFNDRMTYLVFSPYWNVPPDIAKDETLPAIMKDPAFLDRNNMEVLDAAGNLVDPGAIDLEDPTKYRFRQRPGLDNSLGLVKFMFPNQYNVYLHDTPADSLFARATRSFSHGCVRVEDPSALAVYLLRDQSDWPKERITEAMQALEEKHVKLKEPVPVYLGYWTAAAAHEGVRFVRDVYGIDRRQATLVAERATRFRKSAAAAAADPNPTE